MTANVEDAPNTLLEPYPITTELGGVDSNHDSRLQRPLSCHWTTSQRHKRSIVYLSTHKEGAPGRTRTCDLLLRRQTLYPLSYRRALIEIYIVSRSTVKRPFSPQGPMDSSILHAVVLCSSVSFARKQG